MRASAPGDWLAYKAYVCALFDILYFIYKNFICIILKSTSAILLHGYTA